MKICGVYRIRCAPNGNSYIGSSVNVHARWADHRSKLRHGKHWSRHLQRSWNKYGDDAFSFEIVEVVVGDPVLAEQAWIDLERPKFNTGTCAARPMLGRKHSPEIRARISAAGRGRTPDEETRSLISTTLKNSPKVKAVLEKMRALNIGRKKSPEEIAKMSESLRVSPKAIAQRSALHSKTRGSKWSEKARANHAAAWTPKLRAAQRARIAARRSKQMYEKISASLRSSPKAQAQRRALHESLKGHSVSPETRAKIGAANRGKRR